MARIYRPVGFVVLAGALLLSAAASTAQVSDRKAGKPVSPVLSPPLREIPPIQVTRDPGKPRDRRMLPYKGLQAGAAPSRQPDGAVQSAPGISAPNATGVNFEGLAANGAAPPDSDGKVGPNHFIEWINSNFAIYDKAGTILYGPAAGNTLFTSLGGVCAGFNDGDPVVQYDNLADRWVLSQFAVGAPAPAFSHQCVAVSKTGDPLGAYYLYDFPTSASNFIDYPKWTTWIDAYYMSAHMFNAAGTAFFGPMLYSFDRSSMLAGLPAAFQSVNLDVTASIFGQLVADLDGISPPPPGSPAYVFAPAALDYDGTGPGLHFWTAASTWGGSPTLTVTAKPDIATAAYNTNLCNFSRDCIPQLGTTQKLDSLNGQLMFRVAYRNLGGTESILVSHTVNALVFPANQAAVRWYEIRTPGTTPTVFQQSTYAPTSANRWVSSIAMDESGNIAAGYSISDGTMFPSINITGRQTFDPPNTLGSEITMFAGLGNQNGALNRWGDYTLMSVDPRDGCSFWYINQYQPANGSFNWKTRVASFRFANCVAPLRGTLTGLVKDGLGNPIEDAVVLVDAGFSGATDSTGRYIIVLPPGVYNVTATDPASGCTASASQAATVTNGATTTRNFTLTGAASLAVKSTTVDDSAGNGNGVINRNECFKLDVDLSNDGCSGASAISASLTTSTPGVEILVGTSSYPDLARAADAFGATPFSLATTAAFVCGTDIALTLTVTSSAGVQVSALTLPTCTAVTPLVINSSVLTTAPDEKGRLGRSGITSNCLGNACPGDFVAGANRKYDAQTIPSSAPTSRCITITATTSGCAAAVAQITPVAYKTTFDPINICTNYIGDGGNSPTPGPVTFTVNLPAGQPLIVVMEAASGAFTGCGSYTLSIAGLVDNTDGGRPVAAASGGGTICLGGSVGLIGSGGTTCLWTPATGLDDPNSCMPTASPTVTTPYTVVVSNASGCVSEPSAPVTVTVNPAPATPVITAPASVGAGSPNRIASTPAVVGATYAWSITNGTITGGQGTNQITFTAGTAGTLTLGLIETVGGCPSANGSANVTVGAVGAALQFYPLPPCRVVDTRNANGPLGGPALGASGSPDRSFILTGGTCGIPAGAVAVSSNLTVVIPSAGGALSIYRGDGALTGTTLLSFNAGKSRADNALLQLALDGSGTVKVNNSAAGTVNFVLDVNGYFQ